MKSKLLRLAIATFCAGVLFLTNRIPVSALDIKYNDQEVTYTDTEVTYTLDGTTIYSKYPGIIIDGVSLAPFTDIFCNSGTGITYNYNRGKKTVDLYYGSQEINFSLDSTIAVVNDEIVPLPLAPRIVEFTETGTRKVYLPARFVAESFGFSYVWNSKSGIAAITSPSPKIRYQGKDHIYDGPRTQVYSDGTVCTSGSKYGLVINKTIMVPAKTVFGGKAIGAKYSYDSSSKTVILKKQGITISMQLNSTIASINGNNVNLPEAPRQIKLYQTGTTQIYVPLQFIAESFGYKYQTSTDLSRVDLESPYRILYNDQWITPSIKGLVTFNDKPIDVTPAHSFITNNTAMLQARAVFQKGLGCEFEYDKQSKLLTIRYKDNTLVLQTGSTVAFLNNKEVTAPIAPASVKYDTSGSYLMVPGRFVAESLGFHYEWVEATSTSVITLSNSEHEDTMDSDEGEDAASDNRRPIIQEGSISSIEANLFNWKNDTVFDSYISEMKEKGMKSGVVKGRTQQKSNPLYTTLQDVRQEMNYTNSFYDTYTLYSPEGFFDVKGCISGDAIELEMPDTITVNRSYSFTNGLIDEAAVTFLEDSLTSKVTLHITGDSANSFSMALSDDNSTLTIRVYRTVLTSMKAERKNGMDTLVFAGNGNLNIEILDNAENEDMIILRMNGIMDSLTETSWNDTPQGGILSVIRVPLNTTQTQVLIQKKSGCEYYMKSSGDQFCITVMDSSSVPYSLRIPFLPGTNINNIQDMDDYHNNRFLITLPGDQRAYLDSNPIQDLSDTVTGTSYTLNNNGDTIITVSTSKLQAYKLHYTSEAILLEVGNPRDLYKNIVVLDPGHGGKDPGAQRNGVDEKDLNLNYIYTYLKDYFKNSSIKAYWTRTDDSFMNLNNRAAFASKVGADLFISMHMNTYTTPSPHGLSVFYSTNNWGKSGGMNSKMMADLLQRNLISGLGAYDRKAKTCTYVVCRNNTVPAVLIELGFLTNPNEFSKLNSIEYQQKTSKILYESLVEIFKTYPTGR